ncbi:MAG: KEOPS complex subunit Pcc1 [Nitrososphaerota archaeon]
MASFSMRLNLPLPAAERDMVLAALGPELSERSKRTELNVRRTEEGIEVSIDAADLVAARAAVNSFIRLLNLSISTYRVVGVEQ